MTLADVLVNLLYSLGGGVVGFFLGRAGRAVVEHEPRRRLNDRLQNLLGVVVLACLVVAGVTWSRQTTCQLEANKAYAAGLSERAAAAEVDREADRIRWRFIQEALVEAIAHPVQAASRTPEQRVELSRRWLDDLRRADALVASAEARRQAAPAPGVRDCS